jgi:hypothetical protein
VPPLEAGWHAARTLRRWLRPPQAPGRQIAEVL